MNRRIGRLIQIGLFAALPLGWTSIAAAQNVNPGTTNDVPSVSGNGINPAPQGDLSSQKSSDQLKANQMDSTSPTPLAGPTQQQGSDINSDLNSPQNPNTLQDKSNTMGSSSVGQKSKDQNLDSGSTGSVPGQVDTNDIQRSSGSDLDRQGDLNSKSSDQLNSDTSDLNKSNDETTTKKSKHHTKSSKSSTKSSSTIDNSMDTTQTPSLEQKSNDNVKSGSDINNPNQ